MIELEKTYLAKYIPESIKNCDFKEIIDIYIPLWSQHPKLRIRKNWCKFEITKKEPIKDWDFSNQNEQTIILTEEEFNVLWNIPWKRVSKIRYYYKYENLTAEIDIFKDWLEWLVTIDFEFNNLKDKDIFIMPDFCLTDITQENFIAGWIICGKKYNDIKNELDKFKYKKLFLK